MAYLYGEIESDVTIYMRAPQGVNLESGYVYRLKKSLYGLKQSGRIWNKLIDEKRRAVDFIPIDEDACVYIRRNGSEVSLLLLYVDDIICSASNKDILVELVQYLRSLFKLKLMGVPSVLVDLPVPSQLLGLELIWGEGFKSVQINSSKLVRELLKMHYKDNGTKSNKVPVDPTFKFSKNDVLVDNGDLSNADKAMQSAYRTIVGVAIFLVTTCRVDISYATTQLARYMSKPGHRHYRAAYRIYQVPWITVSRFIVVATREFVRMQTPILALMSREEHAQDMFLYLLMGRFGGSVLLVKRFRSRHAKLK